MSKLGKKILAWRTKKEWTQQDVAMRTGVGVSTVARWEQDKSEPSPLALKQLAVHGFQEGD